MGQQYKTLDILSFFVFHQEKSFLQADALSLYSELPSQAQGGRSSPLISQKSTCFPYFPLLHYVPFLLPVNIDV